MADFYRSKKKKSKEVTDADAAAPLTLKAAILQTLTSAEGALSKKKLQKASLALVSDSTEAGFVKALDVLTEKGKVQESDKGYVRTQKPAKAAGKKRKADNDDNDADDGNTAPPADEGNDDPPLKKKSGKDAAATGGYSAASSAANMDLSRNGEQAWRDGLLSQEYLATNPDGITRLFCGNLNRKITEEVRERLYTPL